MALPENVGTGTVVGRIIDADGNPVQGSITFTPAYKKLLNVTAPEGSVTILPTKKTVNLDVNGAFSIVLMATDDTDNNPSDWTWGLQFSLDGYAMDSFSIAVPQGITTDIAVVAPVGSRGGVTIVRGPGVPVGGTAGQVLTKVSATDDDTAWTTIPGVSPMALGDLTDCSSVVPVSGQSLVYDGTQWGPGTVDAGTVGWDDVQDKPSTFAPSEHTHPTSEVDGLDSALSSKANVLDLATVATTGSYNDLTDKPSGGGSGDHEAYIRYMSEFSTAGNDDQKLDAFMAWAQTQTNKGATLVLDENKTYSFSQQHQLYSGFSMRGSHRPQDQPRSSKPIGNVVSVTTTGGLFTLPPGNTFGVSISNLSFDMGSNARLVEGRNDGVLWTSVFRDISWQNGASVLGSKAQKLLVTACTVDGWWNVNNVRECGFVIGGSDFYFKPSMMLLDTSPPFMAISEYLLRLENLSNCWISGLYLTSDGHSAVLLDGGSNDESVFVKDNIFEGRNENTPCPGSLIRVDGGQYLLKDNRYAFAMTDPASTGRDDGGVIHVKAGDVLIDGGTYHRATGVSEDVPFVYASGGKVRVRNIMAQGFTGKPKAFEAVAGLIDADNSVEVITPTPPVALTGAGNVTTIAGSGTSVTVDKPANVANGDLLVACIWGRSNDLPYTTPPSGWTEHAPSSGSDSVGVVRFYTRPITSAGTEPASYAWSGGNSGRYNGIIFRVTGANNSDPVAASTATATGIAGPERIIIPSTTATEPASLLVMAGCANTTGNTGGVNFSEATVSQVANVVTATASAESSTDIDAKVVASGSTGTVSWIADKLMSSSIGYAIVINPA